MSNYASLLEAMMNAVLADDTTSARALYLDKEGFSPENQLAVYLHGYRSRLHKIIRNTYPVLLYYLGKENFRILVNNFITAKPSRYFNIDRYAVTFGEYVADTHDDPFACELAFLGSTLRAVYHLPETPPLDTHWLEQQTPVSLTNTHLHLRTASCVLAFSYPVSEYITSFFADEKPEKPAESPTYLMVLRDGDEMHRVTLEEAEYILLMLVAEGQTLGEALANKDFLPFAGDEHLAENFQQWFSRWVNEGFFVLP